MLDELAMRRLVLKSALRRWGLLPPLVPEPVSVPDLRRSASLLIGFALFSTAFDLGLYVALRGDAMISQSALRAFTWINVPLLLTIALVLRLSHLRADTPVRAVELPVVIAAGLTVMTWIQLTGTTSTYFVVAVVVGIVFFRAMWGWTAGITCTIALWLMHLSAFALEELGVLPRSSLMVQGGAGIEAVRVYRVSAITSIAAIYPSVFIMANMMVHHMRAQRRELERVRRDLAGLADGMRRGRLTGTELGRWFIDELLGRGGMGEVYAAHDERGRQVAVKVIHRHLVDDPTALARFEQEHRVAQRMASEHFPQLVEVARADDGTPYFVMERLLGEDLGALLNRRKHLSIDETISLARALAVALDALHAEGITHRDITPANVFLVASSDSSWPNLRLLDLGTCKLRDAERELTMTAALLGTPGYMAPEQIEGPASAIGPSTDVFACANVLYRALTGQTAFRANTLLEAIENVCRREPVPASLLRAELSPAVDAVFARALAKRPEQRFARTGELAEALTTALGSSRERGPSPSPESAAAS